MLNFPQIQQTDHRPPITAMLLPFHIHFLQRGWINSNTVLITGGAGPVVVDTGHPSNAAETVQLIGQSVDLAAIRLIVNTHCHLGSHWRE